LPSHLLPNTTVHRPEEPSTTGVEAGELDAWIKVYP